MSGIYAKGIGVQRDEEHGPSRRDEFKKGRAVGATLLEPVKQE